MDISEYGIFLSFRNPNGNNTKVVWPPYTPSTQAYIDFSDPITQKDHVFKDRMEFWRKTVPNIINQDNAIGCSGKILPCIAMIVFSFILIAISSQ